MPSAAVAAQRTYIYRRVNKRYLSQACGVNTNLMDVWAPKKRASRDKVSGRTPVQGTTGTH